MRPELSEWGQESPQNPQAGKPAPHVRAGFQAITIETASVLTVPTHFTGEFPLSQFLFEGFEPQQNAAILPDHLPIQPTAEDGRERRQEEINR
jgi:hypothetical protein